ncbi:hypothetical protein [Trinickia symbiotica]|uniref:Uncharacterized protein n=1 Tax=Trinickia symbiotica TaxID=863227 RepID=A0A2N7XA41_9BURK|nr:hypothetical protein [Trinickia symbiotica]PMS38477.1 hypothetical protein C0Z20_00910 [Trinickia symbiotica]
MDPTTFDPSAFGVGGNTFGFSLDGSAIGPQSDGTNIVPSTGMAITGADQAGYGATYAPDVFKLLSQGLGTFTNLTAQNNLLNYQRYEATQAGLVAQGQAATSYATATMNSAASNRTILILGIFAVIALAIHKG